MTQGYTRWTSRLAAASSPSDFSVMTIPRSQTGSGSQAPSKIRSQLRRPVKQPAQPMLFWRVCQRNGSCRPCAAASRHCVHCCEQQRCCDPCCCPVVYCDRHYQPFAISPFANPLVACSQHVPLHVRPRGAAAPSLPAPTQDRFLRRGAYHVLFRTIAAAPVHVPPHGHAPPACMVHKSNSSARTDYALSYNEGSRTSTMLRDLRCLLHSSTRTCNDWICRRASPRSCFKRKRSSSCCLALVLACRSCRNSSAIWSFSSCSCWISACQRSAQAPNLTRIVTIVNHATGAACSVSPTGWPG